MTTVRALSIRQPWSDAIVAGLKDVENRTWTTSYRGVLAIHSGLAPARPLRSFGGPAGVRDFHTMHESQLARAGMVEGSRLTGHVIGVVDLVECHPSSACVHDDVDGPGALCSPWALPDPGPYAKRGDAVQWHWILANPRRIDPVLASGQLGMFEVDLPD